MNIIPLGINTVLRFVLALQVAKFSSTEDAATIFIIISLVQILNIVEKGRLSAAKTRVIEKIITSDQFNQVHQNGTKMILSFVLVLAFTIFFVGYFLDVENEVLFFGFSIGLLLFNHARNQIANEVRKTSRVYYWLICFQLTFLIVGFTIFKANYFALNFIIFAIFLSDTTFNNKTGEKYEDSNIRATKFKRIEVFTVLIAAFELPVIFIVGGTSNVVAYALLSRLYISVPPVYGQLTRPVWASGEFIDFCFRNKTFTVNINRVLLCFFLLVIISLPIVDAAVIGSGADIFLTSAFVLFATFQVCNRFYKNKYLHNSFYENVSIRMLKYYIFYVIALLFIALLSLSIEVFLICKVLLSAAVLYENLKGVRDV